MLLALLAVIVEAVRLSKPRSKNSCMWQIVENTNLNLLIDLMEFTCIIFHFFFKIVNVFSHPTYCSWCYLYFFGGTLKSLAEPPNSVSLVVYNTYATTAINIPLGRSTANFINIDYQPIVLLKTSITPFFHFSKVWSDTFVNERLETIFWWKGWWLASLYVPYCSFPMIPERIMESKDRFSKGALQFLLFWIHVLWTKK